MSQHTRGDSAYLYNALLFNLRSWHKGPLLSLFFLHLVTLWMSFAACLTPLLAELIQWRLKAEGGEANAKGAAVLLLLFLAPLGLTWGLHRWRLLSHDRFLREVVRRFLSTVTPFVDPKAHGTLHFSRRYAHMRLPLLEEGGWLEVDLRRPFVLHLTRPPVSRAVRCWCRWICPRPRKRALRRGAGCGSLCWPSPRPSWRRCRPWSTTRRSVTPTPWWAGCGPRCSPAWRHTAAR